MIELFKTRQQALEAGHKHYMTGVPCKRGHISPRLTSTYNCSSCFMILRNGWLAKGDNRTRDRANKRKEYYNNHAKSLARAKRVRERPETKARLRVWRATPEQKAKGKERDRRLRRADPARNAWRARRYSVSRTRAMPVWADQEIILRFYREAEVLSKTTGVRHVVDHIYPLSGKAVCGFHVHTNLIVVPAEINNKKYNKMPEELPPELSAPYADVFRFSSDG